MANSAATKVTTVKGGWVKRNARSGQLVAVGTESGIAKASPISITSVKEASARRSAALKRLADR